MMRRTVGCVLVSLLLSACSGPEPAPAGDGAPGPTPVIKRTPIGELPDPDVNAVLAHTKVLSSDEYGGRFPGSKGEDLTVGYLIAQFRQMGLRSGSPDGSYAQKVRLVGMTTEPAPLMIRTGSQELSLRWKDDVVVGTNRATESVSITDSELVFVGYGVVAPEYGWDDYKGLDVTGKTLLMLVNDPPVPDPSDASALDPNAFGGPAMSYYGQWTYKFETALQKGAAGAFIIHDSETAGYAFDVVQASWIGEQFSLAPLGQKVDPVVVQGWITRDQAEKVVALAERDLEELTREAITREFRPVPLGLTASLPLRATLRLVDSRNVVARLEGSDPALRDEHIVYLAHWDHLGVGEPVSGDRVYNGARDNAAGTAALLEIARAFTTLPRPPRRSLLFLSVTAEEQGQLGSEYYATRPIYPLAKTAAVINIDTLNVHGRTRDLTIIGYGASELDDYVRDAAGEQGRVIRPDPEPEQGSYYRSDHFSFAKRGVPALLTEQGLEFLGRPGFGERFRNDYRQNDYHKPSDVVKPDWDLSGAREDMKVLFTVGYRVAEAERLPEWRPGREFRATRAEASKTR